MEQLHANVTKLLECIDTKKDPKQIMDSANNQKKKTEGFQYALQNAFLSYIISFQEYSQIKKKSDQLITSWKKDITTKRNKLTELGETCLSELEELKDAKTHGNHSAYKTERTKKNSKHITSCGRS